MQSNKKGFFPAQMVETRFLVNIQLISSKDTFSLPKYTYIYSFVATHAARYELASSPLILHSKFSPITPEADTTSTGSTSMCFHGGRRLIR